MMQSDSLRLIDKESTGNTMASFRDKVLGSAQAPVMREKVDLLAQKLVTIEHVQGNKLCPMLHVEKKVIDELSVPWKDALVVKLLDGHLVFDSMKSNLGTAWNLEGKFDMKEIGNDFFMVKFNSEDGKSKVIDGVPWKICNRYLLVRQWTSDFNVENDPFNTMVWVRIPRLNFMYYDESFLWALASTIGNPVKVDFHTLRVEHGKFVRVCVDIAFRDQVVGKVGINGEWYWVQFKDEGLSIISYAYGEGN